MALYLGEDHVGTHPFPQEATQMSSNTRKSIGLDVHKDATSIAVLNGVGKLVMESIIHCKTFTQDCLPKE